MKWLTNLLVKGWVEAQSFITTGGTSSQFVKGDGSLDGTTYAVDSNVLHTTGNETKSGSLVIQDTTSGDLPIFTVKPIGVEAGGILIDSAANGPADMLFEAKSTNVTRMKLWGDGVLDVSGRINAPAFDSGSDASKFVKGDGSLDSTVYTSQADIINNLTSTDTNKTLSANMGRVLEETKVNKAGDTMTGPLIIQNSSSAGIFEQPAIQLIDNGSAPNNRLPIEAKFGPSQTLTSAIKFIANGNDGASGGSIDFHTINDDSQILLRRARITNDGNAIFYGNIIKSGSSDSYMLLGGGGTKLLSDFATPSDIPTNNTQLTNGSGYITAASLNGYATESWATSNFDNYQSWNLKTNGVQRTTIQSGGTLDLVAGTNTSLQYSAGGQVTINSSFNDTTYTVGTGLNLTGTEFSFDQTYGDNRYELQSNKIGSFSAINNTNYPSTKAVNDNYFGSQYSLGKASNSVALDFDLNIPRQTSFFANTNSTNNPSTASGLVLNMAIDNRSFTMFGSTQNPDELWYSNFNSTRSGWWRVASREWVQAQNYLTTETDPIFQASPAAGITNTNITSWNEKGVQLTADQPTANIHLRDSAGNIISTLNVGFLNNEGTTIFFNSVTDEIELKDDAGNVLSSFPASALMTGVGFGLNLTGSTLELLDSANNIIDSVTLTIANIQNLQSTLNTKADKTTTITGTGDITGGGDLSANRTLDLTAATKTKINNGQTAYGWGNHTNAGYLTTETDPTVPSHVKSITTTNISNWNGKAELSDINNGTLTLTTGTGLTGSDTFSANQGTNTTFTVGLSAATQASLALADSALQVESDPIWDAQKKNYKFGVTYGAVDVSDALSRPYIAGNGTTAIDANNLKGQYAAYLNNYALNTAGSGMLLSFVGTAHGLQLQSIVGSDNLRYRRTKASATETSPGNWTILASQSWVTSQNYITASSIPTVNNGTLTLSTGTGLTGSDTFSANQSANTTFTVGLSAGTLASLNKADTALQSESDPIFTASPAFGITSGNITNWNTKFDVLSGSFNTYDNNSFGVYEDISNGATGTPTGGSGNYHVISFTTYSGTQLAVQNANNSLWIRTVIGGSETFGSWIEMASQNWVTNQNYATTSQLFSGAYADLTGKPTIPTNNNQLTNGANYITAAQIPPTNLGITGTTAARTITSSTGTNATIPAATTSVSGVMTAAQVVKLNGKEDAFSKNTAFNKNFGTTAGTVSEGNHTHPASDITSGTFPYSRLPITSAQVSNWGDAYTHSNITSGNPHGVSYSNILGNPPSTSIPTLQEVLDSGNDILSSPHTSGISTGTNGFYISGENTENNANFELISGEIELSIDDKTSSAHTGLQLFKSGLTVVTKLRNIGGVGVEIVGQDTSKSGDIAARLRTDLLTGMRTFQFPNASGTLALTSNIIDSLSDLSDVDVTGAEVGDILVFNGEGWLRQNAYADSGWQTVSYNTTNVDTSAPFNDVRVKKIGNRLIIKGTLAVNTGNTNPIVFTLPTGYRPDVIRHDNISYAGGTVSGIVPTQIDTNGEVLLYTANSLAYIHFVDIELIQNIGTF